MTVKSVALAGLTGNIDSAIKDHLAVPVILRSIFLINTLPRSKRLDGHIPYTYSVHVLVLVGHHSKRTAWRYHIVEQVVLPSFNCTSTGYGS